MHPSYAHAHLIRALLLDGYIDDRRGAIVEFEEVLQLMPHHPQRAAIETELPRPESAAVTHGRIREDIYLLGIICNIHESSAALVKNGVLIAAAEEERFSRKKHDSRFPALAHRLLPSRSRHLDEEVSYAGFYWQPWKGLLKRVWWLVRYFPASLQTFQGGKRWRGSVGTLVSHLAVPLQAAAMGFRGTFYFIDHHTAHAASAFLVSPYESAAIFTCRPVRRELHHAFWPGDGHHITPHQAVLPAAFARHLLRGAHTVPRVPHQRG